MWAFDERGNFDGSHRFHDQHVQELQPYCWPPSQSSDYVLCSEDGRQVTHFSQASNIYSTFEASKAACGSPVLNSPSTVSVSSSQSPVSHSPDNTYRSRIRRSYITDDVYNMSHKLRELETAMLGPDSYGVRVYDIASLGGPHQFSTETEKWKQMMEIISQKDLNAMLIVCAKAFSDNDLLTAEWLMSELRSMVSVTGEPMQRLGAYMLEGLVARLAQSGSSIYKTLRCKDPASAELLSYMHLLYELCPYFKFGYLSANGAIAEAMKYENRVHIIDFQIAQGSQWVTLIQALAARPGGPPRIRITGIDDVTSAFARGGGLEVVEQRLTRLAESCKVPFEFNGVSVSGCEVELGNIKVRPGEALAVNFAFMLHHMPDESVDTINHRDRLLRMVKSLSPKVVTLVEQESNTNTAPFLPRFLETLNYYTAIFESIDVTLPRDHKERINVEQHCLAREIVNIIACEGAERVERLELLGKWRSRFFMAGFTPYPLSPLVNATIKGLLQNYCQKYRLQERDGALYLGWMDRDLVGTCAWK